MQQFSGISVDNLIGRITKGKGRWCSCIINESALLCYHAQKSMAVRANADTDSKGKLSWRRKKEDGVIEASNHEHCLFYDSFPPYRRRLSRVYVYTDVCMYCTRVCVYLFLFMLINANC